MAVAPEFCVSDEEHFVELERKRRRALSSGNSLQYHDLNSVLGVSIENIEDPTLDGIGEAERRSLERSQGDDMSPAKTRYSGDYFFTNRTRFRERKPSKQPNCDFPASSAFAEYIESHQRGY